MAGDAPSRAPARLRGAAANAATRAPHTTYAPSGNRCHMRHRQVAASAARAARRLDLLYDYVSYRFACAREDLQTFICALNLACTLILVGSSEASPVLHARSRDTVPYRNWYLKRVKGLSKNLYVDV